MIFIFAYEAKESGQPLTYNILSRGYGVGTLSNNTNRTKKKRHVFILVVDYEGILYSKCSKMLYG